MEEKRENSEKELLEEELDLEELNRMNEDKLDSDEEEVNKLIGKKYTRNEIEQLFLLAEIESSGEIEEKEKNLAYDEDANQNSKKSKHDQTYFARGDRLRECPEAKQSAAGLCACLFVIVVVNLHRNSQFTILGEIING